MTAEPGPRPNIPYFTGRLDPDPSPMGQGIRSMAPASKATPQSALDQLAKLNTRFLAQMEDSPGHLPTYPNWNEMREFHRAFQGLIAAGFGGLHPLVTELIESLEDYGDHYRPNGGIVVKEGDKYSCNICGQYWYGSESVMETHAPGCPLKIVNKVRTLAAKPEGVR